MNRGELERQAGRLRARYAAFQAEHLALDMSRGKPCPEQLDLSAGLLDCVGRDGYRAADGTDCRNYGVLEGLPEARRLFADYLDVDPSEILVGGNSSLTLMHDALVQALLRGVPGGERPWRDLPAVKFLCPTPGYDRHFAICQHLGVQMLNVDMGEDGPDMEQVEVLAASDPTIKGIWCVPKYSNPTGVTYSDSVVERLARMPAAAPDFRIFWDNAYAVHSFSGPPDRLNNVLAAAKRAGHPDRVLLFGSTSKVSFPGAGVAMVGGSATNIRYLTQALSIQTIGPDKLNQLRHVRFFRDMAGIAAQMRRHAQIIKPKFDAVNEVFDRELAGKEIAAWSRPRGGYFISLDTLDGCAARVVSLAAAAGVTLTPAGATFPYGKDPRDRNIRLAPTLPSRDEVRAAMERVAVCVQLAAIEKLTG